MSYNEGEGFSNICRDYTKVIKDGTMYLRLYTCMMLLADLLYYNKETIIIITREKLSYHTVLY